MKRKSNNTEEEDNYAVIRCRYCNLILDSITNGTNHDCRGAKIVKIKVKQKKGFIERRKHPR